MYVKSLKAIEVQTHLDVRDSLKQYHSMQTLSPHFSYHLYTYFSMEALFKIAMNVPARNWGAKELERMSMYDVSSLLAFDYRVSGMFQNNRQYSIEMLERPADCSMPAEKIIRYYYGSLTFSALRGERRLKNIYEEGLMAVTLEQFSSWEFKIRNTFVDSKEIERTLWVVLTVFCCMRYNNYARYLPGDNSTDMKSRSHPRRNNV